MNDNEIVAAIQDYFKNYDETHPAVIESTGWLAMLRDLLPQDIPTANIEKISIHPLFTHQINASIYQVYDDRLPMMIAIYDDGMVLWLDDVSNNDDFVIFSQRENLINQVLANPHAAAGLLVKTKFAFWYRPQLILSAYDVPQHLESTDVQPIEDEGLQEWYAEKERRFYSIINKVFPPVVTQDQHTATLVFYVWTHAYGKILHIQCNFRFDGSFDYHIVELVEQVGYCFRW